MQPLRENNMESPQKLKTELPYGLALPPPGYLSRENKHTNEKRYMYSYAHHTVINSQDMEGTYAHQ